MDRNLTNPGSLPSLSNSPLDVACDDAGLGFANPVVDAQRVFRCVLAALSRPGLVGPIATALNPPAPLSPGITAVLLALADFETTVWLDQPLSDAPAVAEFLRFHTSARITTDPAVATFAAISDPASMPALSCFAQGTPEYPDRSTTLIIQSSQLVGAGATFTGPGIDGSITFAPVPMPADFLTQLETNRGQFPMGVDLVFVTADRIAALPRSARQSTHETMVPSCT